VNSLKDIALKLLFLVFKCFGLKKSENALRKAAKRKLQNLQRKEKKFKLS